jgi:hypothetical protein
MAIAFAGTAIADSLVNCGVGRSAYLRRSAAWLVGQIGKLYAVEKHLREQNAGPQLRAAGRAWQSRPILERLRRALEFLRTVPAGA